MLLLFPDGEPFATSAQPYLSRPVGSDPSNRLILEIEVGGFAVAAVVDTGAPYLVLDPLIALAAGVNSASRLSGLALSVRGYVTPGFLHRIDVVIRAERGKDIAIDATAFVPEVPNGTWNLPCYIGLDRLP